jgi:hypothetical protein
MVRRNPRTIPAAGQINCRQSQRFESGFTTDQTGQRPERSVDPVATEVTRWKSFEIRLLTSTGQRPERSADLVATEVTRWKSCENIRLPMNGAVVAQTAGLLYRRPPACRAWKVRAPKTYPPPADWQSAIQQTGGLRYVLWRRAASS